ncbi:MAG TPA: hypothetical protein VGN72_20225 [Tepidisphaeraceae bacterium]|nr:hypothetical protein [Tepidisphaeraceae bacterium]
MATQTINDNQVLHARYGGRSFDVPLQALDLTGASPDREVKQRLAGYLEVNPRQLDAYVVDRHTNGNLTLRPEAVFG